MTTEAGTTTATFAGEVAQLPAAPARSDLGPLVVGDPFDHTVGGGGSPAPVFSVTGGALPPGLRLDPATGRITGTPTGAGPYSFTVTATNAAGSVSTTFSGVVDPEDRGYLGVVPARVFDSRSGGTRVEAGSVTRIRVADVAGVPADARAVVLNVAVTGTTGSGYASVYPCGDVRPPTSSLNYDAGETRSNAVTTEVGSDGTVCVYTTQAVDLVVDVNGAFSPTVGLGELAPLAPFRLFDSRLDGTPVRAGSVTALDVAGRAGVPADAGAVVLNVTATEPQQAGFLTVFPCGNPLPVASNVNFEVGQTVPNAVTAAIGEGGRVCVYSTSDTHLVVDLNAAYTPDGIGSLRPVMPERVLDTRLAGGPVPAGTVVPLVLAGRGAVSASAVAVALNVTVVGPDRDGYARVFPCAAGQSLTSNVNFTAGQDAPNAVTVALDDAGQVCVYTMATAHLVVDLNGVYIP